MMVALTMRLKISLKFSPGFCENTLATRPTLKQLMFSSSLNLVRLHDSFAINNINIRRL